MVTIRNEQRRVWAEIDLDALEYNYRKIRERMQPDVALCCVIKANAYGHGAVDVAAFYEELGVEWLAVSNIEEAIQLRHGGITCPILILGYTPAPCVCLLAEHCLTQCVYSYEYAEILSQCAVREGVTLDVHLKLDTGMGRIGFAVRDLAELDVAVDEMARVCTMQGLAVKGAFTHFAVADDGAQGATFCREQHELFCRATDALAHRGIDLPCRHCANSAGLSDYPDYHMDMVRAGVVLYGLQPSQALRQPLDVRPVMTLKSVVSHVKTVRAGESVSYGRAFVATQDMKVATVPIGYADGYRRSSARGGAWLWIRGRRCPIVGRVCMDQLMVDVSHVPLLCVGDEVTMFGCAPAMTADELAECNETIGYEIVCAVGVRVPRVYLREGRVVCVRDHLLSEGRD